MIKKVLFVGLGSAGQRHLRNLLELLGDHIEVMAYRYHKSERVFNSDMKVVADEGLAQKYRISEFDDYEKALDEKPDIVIIANPNNMHIPYALKAAERGIDLFIEKPLSVTLDMTDELADMIDRKHLVCQVGFQQRYHPCIRQAKEYLEEGKLGKIVSVNAEVGERISRMHSYEDYRGMVEARKDLGGGVVLCQVHEIDYLLWLFGMPDSVVSVGGKRSDFEIDVEDTATTLFRYKQGEDEFAILLHQDFIQYPPSRKCKIIGTKGRIEMDLLNSRFCYVDYETEKGDEEIFSDFNRNEMFIAELKNFLSCVESRKLPECDVRAARNRTKIGIAIKKSFADMREIKVSEVL